MVKSPEAFRTISEVADEMGLPQHVLRFWETRFHQIKPLKRGGGRRYYRPDDVDLVRGIKHLLYGEGYTIKGVQRILKEQGPRFVQAVWRKDIAPLPLAPRHAEDADEVIHTTSPEALLQSGQSPEAASNQSATPELMSAARSLSHGDVVSLQTALNTLEECRRILSEALKDKLSDDQAAA